MLIKRIARLVGSALIVIGLTTSYVSGNTVLDIQHRIETTRSLQNANDDLCYVLLNAETAQRGFILTGQERYLDPYHEARASLSAVVLTLDKLPLNIEQTEFRVRAERSISAKMDELGRTVALRRESGFEAALDLVKTDEGRIEMDRIRALFRAERIRTDADLVRLRKTVTSLVQGILGGLALAGLGGLAFLMQARPRRRPDTPL